MEYHKCEAWLLQRTRLDEEGAIFQLVLQLAKNKPMAYNCLILTRTDTAISVYQMRVYSIYKLNGEVGVFYE